MNFIRLKVATFLLLNVFYRYLNHKTKIYFAPFKAEINFSLQHQK